MTKVPKYWNKAKRYLSKKDKTISNLIKNYKSPSEIILTSTLISVVPPTGLNEVS